MHAVLSCCNECERIAEDEKHVVFRVVFVGLGFNVIMLKDEIFTIVTADGIAACALETLDPEMREEYLEFDVVRAFNFEVNHTTDLGALWKASTITPPLAQYLEHAALTLFGRAFDAALKTFTSKE